MTGTLTARVPACILRRSVLSIRQRGPRLHADSVMDFSELPFSDLENKKNSDKNNSSRTGRPVALPGPQHLSDSLTHSSPPEASTHPQRMRPRSQSWDCRPAPPRHQESAGAGRWTALDSVCPLGALGRQLGFSPRWLGARKRRVAGWLLLESCSPGQVLCAGGGAGPLLADRPRLPADPSTAETKCEKACRPEEECAFRNGTWGCACRRDLNSSGERSHRSSISPQGPGGAP